MLKNVLITILAAAVAGVLYRLGGKKGYDTLYRDIGVAAVSTLVFALWFGWMWSLGIVAVLTYGALTTYFSRLNILLGYPQETKFWWNWALVGFVCSFAAFPLAFELGYWGGFWCRVILCTFLVAIWRVWQGDVDREEMGTGVIIVLSQLLFLMR